MGIAGAAVGPSTLSLLFNMFADPRQRMTAFGVWISASSLGGAIGPVVGGAMLERFWWGSVFLLAVPVMALLLTLGARLLPEFRVPNSNRLDLLSAAMSLAAVLAAISGLKEIAQHGVGPGATLAIITGVGVGAAFVRRQGRISDPLIDPALFRNPRFRAAVTTNVMTVFVAMGYFLYVAQYLQLVVGLSPLTAGLWSLPSALAFTVSSNVAPRLLQRFPRARALAACLALAAGGLVLLTLVTPDSGVAIVAVASVVVSTSLAPVFGLTTELIVGSAPPERAGSASGIAQTCTEVGGALGVAILGSLGATVYRTSAASGLPAGLPNNAVEVARSTLGGAVGVAAQLPDVLAAPLLIAARSAFVDAIHLGAAAGAAVALMGAVTALLTLRQRSERIASPAASEDAAAAD